MQRNRTTLIIAEVAILAAFALTLDYLAQVLTGSLFIYGGSISIAIVPIIVISFRRGLIAGLACGFLVGTIQVIYGGHFLEFFQYMFDYPIAFMVVGLASLFVFFKKGELTIMNIIIGAVFAGFLRYFSHFLAGVFFWSEYVPDEFVFGTSTLTGFNAFTWSLFYNALYMVPTIILSAIVTATLYKYSKVIFKA